MYVNITIIFSRVWFSLIVINISLWIQYFVSFLSSFLLCSNLFKVLLCNNIERKKEFSSNYIIYECDWYNGLSVCIYSIIYLYRQKMWVIFMWLAGCLLCIFSFYLFFFLCFSPSSSKLIVCCICFWMRKASSSIWICEKRGTQSWSLNFIAHCLHPVEYRIVCMVCIRPLYSFQLFSPFDRWNETRYLCGLHTMYNDHNLNCLKK